MRDGSFLYCSTSGLQGDNQFRNNDSLMSFEVSEVVWEKKRPNPWDNCKAFDLVGNFQDYRHKLAANSQHSSFTNYMLHVVQP